MSACDSSVPDSVRFENVVWNNPAHYRQTEYGYDEDGDFTFTLEDSEDTFIVLLGDRDIEYYDGVEDDIESLLNRIQDNINKECKIRGTSTTHISQNNESVVFRRYFNAQEEHKSGFIDILLIDNKYFVVSAIGTRGHMDELKKTAESVHIASSSDQENLEDSYATIGIPTLSSNNVLGICDYIPDHELLPEAQSYMTTQFYSVLSKAFALADDDPFGAGEFLFYFVTGNGGSKPYYEVLSVNRTDTDKAVATISVRDLWGKETIPSKDAEQHIHTMTLVREGKRWLMDNFDNRKEECIIFVKSNNSYQ